MSRTNWLGEQFTSTVETSREEHDAVRGRIGYASFQQTLIRRTKDNYRNLWTRFAAGLGNLQQGMRESVDEGLQGKSVTNKFRKKGQLADQA